MHRPRFGKRLYPVAFFQALNNRFFHNALTCRYARQLAGKAAAFHGKRAVGRNQFLPRNLINCIKQFVKCYRFGAFEQHQNALGTAAFQIGSGQNFLVAAKRDAPVCHGHILCANAFKIKCSGTFHPEVARGHKCIFQNISSFTISMQMITAQNFLSVLPFRLNVLLFSKSALPASRWPADIIP